MYNEKRYLESCIESILNQTYRNLEIIIIDDGSEKSVSDKCDSFSKTDKRVTVIHKKNEGLSAARVTGIENATGDYIFFVDDDDVITSNCIEVLIKADRSSDIITGRSIDLDLPESFSEIHRYEQLSYKIMDGKNICEWMATDKEKQIITPLWGKLYRKSYIESIDLKKYIELCPTIYFEDVLMTPILYRLANKVTVVDCIIYIHREVASSISHAIKLGPYYYEQIESGNILLEFCKTMDIPKMFQFELEIYYRVILRIFCLIDMEQIDDIKKADLKNRIVGYFKKYYLDLLKSNQSIFRKLFYSCFLINKKIWAKLVRCYYFKDRSKC